MGATACDTDSKLADSAQQAAIRYQAAEGARIERAAGIVAAYEKDVLRYIEQAEPAAYTDIVRLLAARDELVTDVDFKAWRERLRVYEATFRKACEETDPARVIDSLAENWQLDRKRITSTPCGMQYIAPPRPDSDEDPVAPEIPDDIVDSGPPMLEPIVLTFTEFDDTVSNYFDEEDPEREPMSDVEVYLGEKRVKLANAGLFSSAGRQHRFGGFVQRIDVPEGYRRITVSARWRDRVGTMNVSGPVFSLASVKAKVEVLRLGGVEVVCHNGDDPTYMIMATAFTGLIYDIDLNAELGIMSMTCTSGQTGQFLAVFAYHTFIETVAGAALARLHIYFDELRVELRP